jgi:hypothetical protein
MNAPLLSGAERFSTALQLTRDPHEIERTVELLDFNFDC